MRRLWLWFFTAVTLFVMAHLHMGIEATSLGRVIVASIVLGLVNLVVRPIVKLLTLPLTLITLGLFGWVVNALMLWLVSALVPGFRVAGFVPALEASVILGIVSGVVNWVIRRRSR
ncbi:phage holin family protein [Sulfobacillus harzensis]|uniref:Phage holin family protein n=1 Tax=Sulfobacillus harzensis TaxID=2729629 RepID=A0A7Y0L3I7_9FIRM|nr:phage holin family protein [Sulfobacillus harzensis]NMP22664.1 phage holin family protein [Sulfobacillus harzensis]